ncbi:RNA polymerase subunit sigma-70 [Niveispirillum lacus]|uniref:RNA polymerase subunit sigma-70 n=1 Tax=Niveispirillum lacus TaxID=1981099 RepID=A0A255YZJ5_9PROT|nr:RNA polymerase sigma factor [Niveispirillum lacus]OYQ34599.1 RNA polymerase subunit sigma-70 [Niveispirillum lacus]
MEWAEQLPKREALYGFILRRVRDPFLADDLVQETLTRLIAYMQSNKVADSLAFSLRIATNLISDHYRMRGTGHAEVLEPEMACHRPSAEQTVMARQRADALARALERMPPLRREVFIRRRLHGQSYREIAQALNLNVAAVEKHVVRALEWLHSEMGREGAR